MNRTSSIVENCRSILREHYCNQRSCNRISSRLHTIPQQGCPPNTWKPCHPIPTNPCHSLYGIDNLRVPVVCCEEPSYCNSLWGLSPTISSNNYTRHSNCINRNTDPIQSIRNRQNNHIPYLSTPSENCIQLITNSIITKIRCKIPQEEIALLCCCLPSLIQEIMCKSPWLTPNDIIQCLSADIIKEAMNCFNPVDFNLKNNFPKSKQEHHNTEKLFQQRKDNKLDDNHSMESHDDDNNSLSSYQSTTNAVSPDSFSSQHLSKSILDVPNNDKTKKTKHGKKQNKSRTPSTRSFTSQQSKELGSDNHLSSLSPSWNDDNQSKKSDRNTSVHLEDDVRSSTSPNKDSNEDVDQKSIDLNPKSESNHPSSSRIHIDFPGKKDPNAARDVENCLAFYQKIREYFDDDVAAMLLKCCLCYGDCSGKK